MAAAVDHVARVANLLIRRGLAPLFVKLVVGVPDHKVAEVANLDEQAAQSLVLN